MIDLPTVSLHAGKWGPISRYLAQEAGLSPNCTFGLREVSEVRRSATGGLEATWKLDDNYKLLTFASFDNPDLSVHIEATPFVTYQPGDFFEVQIRITNHGKVPVEVPVKAWVDAGLVPDWEFGTRLVTVGPGQTVTNTRQVYHQRCKDVYAIHAQALTTEPNQADNHVSP